MSEDELGRLVDAYVDEVWNDALADLRALVRIPSVEDLSQAGPGMPYGPGPREALSCALDIARRMGLQAHDCDGHIGYADVPGADRRVIATIAHTDVVPAGEGWTMEPFEVTRREGLLVGRGVNDDKGALVATLYAAQFFRRQVERTGRALPHTLRVLVGCDEETHMDDVRWYVGHVGQPDFCFTPDADFPLICGEKGRLAGKFESPVLRGGALVEVAGGTVVNAVPSEAHAVVRADASALAPTEKVGVRDLGQGLARLDATGVGGHAALPAESENAIGNLVDYLLANVDLSDGERAFLELEHLVCSASTDGSSLGIASSNDRFGPLTCIGGTVATEAAEGAPGGLRLVQTIDSRYPDSTDAATMGRALSALAAGHGSAFSVGEAKEPFYVDPASPEVQALLSAYRDCTGDMTEPYVIGGGTYARNFAKACAFGPIRPGTPKPGWAGNEHAANESIAEGDLRLALKVYIMAIDRLMRI